MKLNAAAVFAVAVFSLSFWSGTAIALDGIDLSHPAEPTASDACSRLVQIKYPFLHCSEGEIGLSAMGDTWDASRRIAIMSDWVEGDGYWGPDLNRADD